MTATTLISELTKKTNAVSRWFWKTPRPRLKGSRTGNQRPPKHDAGAEAAGGGDVFKGAGERRGGRWFGRRGKERRCVQKSTKGRMSSGAGVPEGLPSPLPQTAPPPQKKLAKSGKIKKAVKK